MGALNGIRVVSSKGSNPRLRQFQFVVKAGIVIYQGAAVGVDPATGKAEPMNGTDNTLVAFGVADFTADGDGVVGPTEVIVRPGVYPMTGSGLGYVDVGKSAYATSDQDISTSSNTGARPVMGMIDFVESATVAWVAVEPPSGALRDALTQIAAGMLVAKKTVTVGHADLTDADGSQTINIGTALPVNARIVGVDMRSLAAFSGGTASEVTVDVGTSGDVDALVDGADLFAAAVDGGPATMPPGIRPNKTFAAGAQLIATFAANDDVADLSAGSVVIDVLYIAPP